jgi:hypothetical protein
MNVKRFDQGGRAVMAALFILGGRVKLFSRRSVSRMTAQGLQQSARSHLSIVTLY